MEEEKAKDRGHKPQAGATLHQPHDKLFKTTFSNIPEAVGMMENHLPQWLSQQLNFSKTERLPYSFIDQRFKHKESDLLFSIPLKTGTQIFVYVLIEHQSSEDTQIALRLLTYMTQAWEHYLKENPSQPLPVIFPMVIAQDRKPWKTPAEFKHLFDLPDDLPKELTKHIPLFQFYLMQLVNIPYSELKGTPDGILVLRVLKAQPLKKLMDEWLWEKGMDHTSEHVLNRVIRYILDQHEVDKNTLSDRIEAIQQISNKEKAMTLAELLRQEGYEQAKKEQTTLAELLRQEGRQEGQLKGRIQNLQQLVTRKYGTLPEWAKHKLTEANEEQVESWVDRIFEDVPLEELLA